MTKFNFKSFIIGVIVGTISISTVFASGGIKLASFNTNKVIFNDVELDLKESQMISIVKDGEENASNYMPVRAVLEQMGYSVEWDGEKGAVIIQYSNINNNKTNTDNDINSSNLNTNNTQNNVDTANYIKFRTIHDILVDNGYIVDYLGYDKENMIDIYTFSSDINKDILLVSIPKSKFSVIDGETYLEKIYVINELLPLLPLLDGKI